MKSFVWSAASAIATLVILGGQLLAADPGPPTAAPANALPAPSAKPTAPNSAASDWPQWHGPNRNSISPETITWPVAGPKQLWKAAVGDGFSCVSVSKGRAYTMGNTNNQDTVWCFDARTGDVVWKYSYPCPNSVTYGGGGHFPGPRATPTIDGNLIYTVSLSGSLLALDADKGTLAWSADYLKDFHSVMRRWGFAGSPLVEGKLLLVNAGGKGASVVAFDKTTGQMVWKSGDELASYSTPVIVTIGGQRLVAMMSSNGLHGYNLADGKELWKTQVTSKPGDPSDDPVALDDKLFLPEYDGNSFALYTADGNSVKEVYHNQKHLQRGFPGSSYMAQIGGLLYGYIGMWDHPAMICIDPDTGDTKWKKDKIGGPFVAAGNKLIFIQSATGKLVVAEVSAVGYKEIGSVPALTVKYEKTESAPALTAQCWIAPSLAQGLVYCRNSKGDVVCLDLSGK